ATTWAQFSDEWAEALNLAPRIHCFVMNDAMTMNGEFRHLREPQRDGKVKLLSDVISRFSPLEVYSVIPLARFNALYEGSEIQELATRLKKPRYTKMVRDPYYLGLSAVISGLARYQLSRGISEKIDFTFDEKRKQEPRVKNAWYGIVETQPAEMQKIISSSPNFANDELIRPLQAADMAAWRRRDNWLGALAGLTRDSNEWGTSLLPLVH